MKSMNGSTSLGGYLILRLIKSCNLKKNEEENVIDERYTRNLCLNYKILEKNLNLIFAV